MKTLPLINIVGIEFNIPGYVLEVVDGFEYISIANDKHRGKKDAPSIC